MDNITIEKYNGVYVLRDDLLPGGTKSILMEDILPPEYDEYVYASPVYGAFQLALSVWCKENNKKATIFCPKKKERHYLTERVMKEGGKVVEVPYGYMNVLKKRASDYCKESGALLLEFGASGEKSVELIAERMKRVIKKLGKEPDEIWCVVGSGTLVEGILKGTTKSKVIGIQVGKEYKKTHERLLVVKYPMDFSKESKYKAPFPSIKNYDLKAWEYCIKYKKSKDVLFWNVYG